MISVLVTGGQGQLASCIMAISKDDPKLNFIFTDYEDLDICNRDALKQFFSDHQLNYCVNCAAYTAVDNAEKEHIKATYVNEVGARNIAEMCKIFNVTLVHISTDFVFDGQKPYAYTEQDATNPISVYGKTKLSGELAVQQTLKKYFILRTSWLYSEYGNNFLKTMLRLSESKDELSVVGDQIGTPTYAKDLAKAILQIIKSDSTKFGIYHYSNDGVASWFDFAKAIFEIAKIKITLHNIKTEEFPTLAERPRFSVLSKFKIKQTLSVKVPYWRDSLELAIQNLKNEDRIRSSN